MQPNSHNLFARPGAMRGISPMKVNRRRSIWSRAAVQLGSCLFIGAVLPFALRYLTIDADAVAVLQQTFVGCVLAIALGIWLLRNVTTYPGVETHAYIIPAMSIAYSALLMVFIFGRIEYNRMMLFSAFVVSNIWLIYAQIRAQRSQMLTVGFRDITGAFSPPVLPRISWVALTTREADWQKLDAVAVDLRHDLPEEWDRALASMALAGVPVFHVKHFVESLTGRVELEHLSENNFGSLIPLSAYRSFKYSLDWIVAAIAIVMLLPVLAIIAIATKASSPGPVFFRQQRIGFRGVPFMVWKFRTMTTMPLAGQSREAAMTQADDARVTKFGRFLRTTRLDELPQILNILRGEMSWIGPRPEAEVLSRWYEAEIPFYRYRHIVRPGITGWAQVCQGHVAHVDEVRDKLQYDFYYIKNFSPWIDILIVARTVRTMLTGFGSR